MTCCHSCDRVLFCPDCDKDYHLKLIDINKLKEAIKQHSTSEFDDDIIELTTLYELIDNHTVDEPVPKSETPDCDCPVCVCGHPNYDHQVGIGDEYAYCLVCSCNGFEEKEPIPTPVEEVEK